MKPWLFWRSNSCYFLFLNFIVVIQLMVGLASSDHFSLNGKTAAFPSSSIYSKFKTTSSQGTSNNNKKEVSLDYKQVIEEKLLKYLPITGGVIPLTDDNYNRLIHHRPRKFYAILMFTATTATTPSRKCASCKKSKRIYEEISFLYHSNYNLTSSSSSSSSSGSFPSPNIPIEQRIIFFRLDFEDCKTTFASLGILLESIPRFYILPPTTLSESSTKKIKMDSYEVDSTPFLKGINQAMDLIFEKTKVKINVSSSSHKAEEQEELITEDHPNHVLADFKFIQKKINFSSLRRVWVINSISIGGARKAFLDLMQLFQSFHIEFFEIPSKESLNISLIAHQDIIYVNHLLFTDFNISDLIDYKTKTKAQLILPIHDSFWLSLNTTLEEDNIHGGYLIYKKVHPDVCHLFQEFADFILHFSKFSLNNYQQSCPTSKAVVMTPSDYKISRPTVMYRPVLKNIIHLGVLTRFSFYKGREAGMFLRDNYTEYKGYSIKFMIVGENIQEYGDSLEGFEEEIQKHHINGLLYLSKWGETYSYAMTKYLISGLPILYNNIGSFKERLVGYPGLFPVFESEREYEDLLIAFNEGNQEAATLIHLRKSFENFLDNIIMNAPGYYHLRSSFLPLNEKRTFDETIYPSSFMTRLFVPDFSDRKNLVIITSKLFVSKNKFSYAGYRSLYSPEERFQQTLETIVSIRKYIPHSLIVLFDNSVLPAHFYKTVREAVDVFLNPSTEKLLNYYTDSYEYKAFAEVGQLIAAYNMYLNELDTGKFTNVFKISGRYTLVDGFNIDNYNKINGNVFRRDKNLDYMKYYYTCFYKIAPSYFHDYFNLLKTLFLTKETLIEKKILNLEEHIPIILNFNFTEIDFLGVRQNMAVWNRTDVI